MKVAWTRRLRARLALGVVSALTGLASLGVIWTDGYGRLFWVLTVLSIASGVGEWGLRR